MSKASIPGKAFHIWVFHLTHHSWMLESWKYVKKTIQILKGVLATLLRETMQHACMEMIYWLVKPSIELNHVYKIDEPILESLRLAHFLPNFFLAVSSHIMFMNTKLYTNLSMTDCCKQGRMTCSKRGALTVFKARPSMSFLAWLVLRELQLHHFHLAHIGVYISYIQYTDIAIFCWWVKLSKSNQGDRTIYRIDTNMKFSGSKTNPWTTHRSIKVMVAGLELFWMDPSVHYDAASIFHLAGRSCQPCQVDLDRSWSMHDNFQACKNPTWLAQLSNSRVMLDTRDPGSWIKSVPSLH